MKDSLGRRRTPSQTRGLRPLHPPLPRGVRSRSVRVAMTAQAWGQLDTYLRSGAASTAPRALGHLLERALREHDERRVTDWLQWQIRKERQLLERRGRAVAS